MTYASVLRYKYICTHKHPGKHRSVCMFEKMGHSESEWNSFKLINCKAITVVSFVLGDVAGSFFFFFKEREKKKRP